MDPILWRITHPWRAPLLVFRVYYERPMLIDSLNFKLRQIVRFLSNMILDKMSSAKCCLLFGIFLIAQHEERPLYHIHMVTFCCLIAQHEERPLYHVDTVTSRCLIAQHEERPLYHVHTVISR